MPAELQDTVDKCEQLSVEDLLSHEELSFESCAVKILKGDGSDRRFIRVGEDRSVIVILPCRNKVKGKAESLSSWLIGKHLQKCGVPVPEMIAHDPQTGAILCEDLGDTLLHQRVKDVHGSELTRLYQEAIDILVNMQIKWYEGFTKGMCWERSVYDRQTMLERESGYFIDSCCSKILGRPLPVELDSEFALLADHAGQQPADFFLHRDFQSRNIMVKDGRLRVIDFQGGRFGPLGYDLASLLIDPYTMLPAQLRRKLLEYYMDRAGELIDFHRDEFMEGYYGLAIQRNLQILGAFAFLSLEKGKYFFAQYLYPASLSLLELLDLSGEKFPILHGVATEIRDNLKDRRAEVL